MNIFYYFVYLLTFFYEFVSCQHNNNKHGKDIARSCWLLSILIIWFIIVIVSIIALIFFLYSIINWIAHIIT